MIRVLLAMLVGAALADMKKPGVLILCDSGTVTPLEEHFGGTLAIGRHCVLHDKAGKTTSTEGISVFDDSAGADP